MIIALNNKSNLTREEFIEYYKRISNLDTLAGKIVLCPSFPHIGLVTPSNVELGAQNVSVNNMGPYTGEVSASQLKSYNIKYTIIGHSERRLYQHETSEEVSKKAKQLINEGITPIICIGETEEEKSNPKVQELLIQELLDSTNNLSPAEYSKIIIAYEPIWSIGTGKIPSNEEIALRIGNLKSRFPMSKILYGGSVNDNNIEELIKNKYLDGFLIGGISLEPDKLKSILEKIKKSS